MPKAPKSPKTHWAVAGLLAVLGWGAAFAQPPAVQLDIEAQRLDRALNAWADQTGYQVLISVERVARGRTAPAVKGLFTPEGALKVLLGNMDLTYQLVGERTVAIREVGEGASSSGAMLARERAGEVWLARAEASADTGAGEQAQDATHDNSATSVKKEEEEDGNSERGGIPEILVTGSTIKSLNMDIRRTSDGTQPYVVFNHKDIVQSGAENLEDFFKNKLTMNTNAMSRGQSSNSLGNTSTINLRGLGTAETLILVDGRRTAGIGFLGAPNQPDINGIPLMAIERIEVLPSTASGIYGGGATGGVINIIMRRDYSGLEAQLTYDNTFKADSARRRVDLSGGVSLSDRTALMLVGSWSDSNELLTQDRDFVQTARNHVVFTNPGGIYALSRFPPLGATTNITTVNGVDLILDSGLSLGSPFTFVPYGYAGPGSDGGLALLANAGEYNLDLAGTAQPGGGQYALVTTPNVKSVLGTLRHQFSSAVDAFVELSVSENAGAFKRNQAAGNFIIPADALGNPFNQAIRVQTPTFGGDQYINSSLRAYRAAGGVILKLPGDWSLGTDYTWNRSRIAANNPGEIAAGAALVAVSDGSLDIFKDTNTFAVDFSPYILPGASFPPAETTLDNVNLRLGGPLPISLPGGPPALSILLEYRKEELGDFFAYIPQAVDPTLKNLYPRQSQTVEGAYAELLLPVISSVNKFPGVRLFDIQLAARHDRYRSIGATSVQVDDNFNPIAPIIHMRNSFHSIDPSIALRYRPIESITLRTSFGTGFLPPALNQITPASQAFTLSGVFFDYLRDPRRGGEPIGTLGTDYTFIYDGAATLQPEESQSWSVGIILTPHFVHGLRASVDWTRIRKSDEITVLTFGGLQSDFDLEKFVPGLILRGPVPEGDPFGVGPVIGVNVGPFNVARLTAAALDFALDYSVDSEHVGLFDLAVRATKSVSRETRLSDIAPIVENAGVGRGDLRWKGNATLTWRRKGWELGWSTHYFDSYYLSADHALDVNQGSATVPSQIYHDLFGGYQFSSSAFNLSLLADVYVSFGIKNVFDKKPPIDVAGQGGTVPGYSVLGDPRLASYYMSIRKSFNTN